MTKKYFTIAMALMMSASLIAGCSTAKGVGTESTTIAASQETAEDLIYGEVENITDDSITINVGTEKEESSDSSSGLDLTGEQKTITITDKTSYERAAPAMPEGDSQGQPPAKPEGDSQGTGEDQKPGDSQGQPPAMTKENINAGDSVSISLDDDGNAETITVLSSQVGGPGGAEGSGGPGGASAAPESYNAVKTYSEDTQITGETISSEGTDENAVYVKEGAKVTVSDSMITRTSSNSTGGDNASFYGTGAAVLTTEGTTRIDNTQINTDAQGGAGVFSYGDGISYVSGTSIHTSQGASGGIHVAGGGTLYAWDTDVVTEGQSSAAIRSDRGGGTIVADGGSYTSKGVGSPAIYSTADIAVHQAELTATGSEAVCIEGNNSIHLFDSTLSGNMSDDEQNDTTWNVILYQSMSGDSEEGNSLFEMDGGSITAGNGGMFYTTNTESTFVLKDVNITAASDSEFFLRCTGNQNQRGWGTAGANGADCSFTGIGQSMQGDIVWDTISQLDFYMTEGSTLTGAVLNDESCAGDGGDGYCNIYIDKDSAWTVTGDSTLTGLYNAGTITDKEGKSVTVKGTDGTVYVKGDSEYTITVKEYKDSADLKGASSISSWSQYQTEKSE